MEETSTEQRPNMKMGKAEDNCEKEEEEGEGEGKGEENDISN